LKYAIISDVHANLEAIEVCFNELDKIKPDRIICLGDLVDYCAEPNEITRLIKNRCDVVLLGNHDEAQYRHEMIKTYTENAAISSVHTRGVLKPEYIEYFKTLKYRHSENGLLFVHASPHEPGSFKYVLDMESAKLNFGSFDEKICFIGHSHLPVIFEESNSGVIISEPGKLNPESRYIINVGSVGQPRDWDPRLSFGYFDTEKSEYINIRLDYDIESASKKIIKEGLPVHLAQRLYGGI
jgi:predicted phosphodiesterase